MNGRLVHNYIGIDQYGQHYLIENHPRKELMEQLGIKHAEKMYVDTTDGKPHHIGYVIGNLWIQVVRVLPLHDD